MRIAQKPERPRRRLASVLAGVGLVAAVIIGVVLFVQSLPANITLNGASVEVHGGKTLGDALSASGVKPSRATCWPWTAACWRQARGSRSTPR